MGHLEAEATDSGSIRHDFKITVAAVQGARRHMEDRMHIEVVRELSGRLSHVFTAVYDGHGGMQASEYVRQHLHNNIKSNKLFYSDNDDEVLEAIRQGFIRTHYNMQKMVDHWPLTASGFPCTAGTTASIAIFRKNKLYTGHVGDSAIMLGDYVNSTIGRAAMKLTEDHKPDDPGERSRIENFGGAVAVKSGVSRVIWKRPIRGHVGPIRRSTATENIPFLAVARALGDFWSLNPDNNEYIVSPEPDVAVMQLSPCEKFVVLASDGLTNVLHASYIAEILRSLRALGTDSNYSEFLTKNTEQDPNYAQVILQVALKRWGHNRADNVSVICIQLEDKQEYDVDDIDTSQVLAEDPFMNVDQQLSAYPSGMIHVMAENTRCLLTNQIRLRCNFKPEKEVVFNGPGFIVPWKEEEVVDDCSDDELWPTTSSSFTADSSISIKSPATITTSVAKSASQNSISATTWTRGILCNNDIVPIYRRSNTVTNNGCVGSDCNDTMIVSQGVTSAVSINDNNATPKPAPSDEAASSLFVASKDKTTTAAVYDTKTLGHFGGSSRKRPNRDSGAANGALAQLAEENDWTAGNVADGGAGTKRSRLTLSTNTTTTNPADVQLSGENTCYVQNKQTKGNNVLTAPERLSLITSSIAVAAEELSAYERLFLDDEDCEGFGPADLTIPIDYESPLLLKTRQSMPASCLLNGDSKAVDGGTERNVSTRGSGKKERGEHLNKLIHGGITKTGRRWASSIGFFGSSASSSSSKFFSQLPSSSSSLKNGNKSARVSLGSKADSSVLKNKTVAKRSSDANSSSRCLSSSLWSPRRSASAEVPPPRLSTQSSGFYAALFQRRHSCRSAPISARETDDILPQQLHSVAGGSGGGRSAAASSASGDGAAGQLKRGLWNVVSFFSKYISSSSS